MAKLLSRSSVIAASFTLAASLVFACSSSSNDNPAPTPSGEGPGGSAGSGSSGTGGASGSGTAGSGGSSAGSGGSDAAGSGGSDAAGSGGSAGSGTAGSGQAGAQDCSKGQPGCFCGAPAQPSDFLNGCTDAQCTPFDNATRAPLFKDGKLPPLQLAAAPE
jgi:hypothetical protein